MANYSVCKKCKRKMYGVKRSWADYCYDCSYETEDMPKLPKIKSVK